MSVSGPVTVKISHPLHLLLVQTQKRPDVPLPAYLQSSLLFQMAASGEEQPHSMLPHVSGDVKYECSKKIFFIHHLLSRFMCFLCDARRCSTDWKKEKKDCGQ